MNNRISTRACLCRPSWAVGMEIFKFKNIIIAGVILPGVPIQIVETNSYFNNILELGRPY